MNNKLKKLLKRLEKGELLNWFEVMEAISAVTNIVTLDKRPPGEPEILTVCELNGRCCCGD